MKLDHHRN